MNGLGDVPPSRPSPGQHDRVTPAEEVPLSVVPVRDASETGQDVKGLRGEPGGPAGPPPKRATPPRTRRYRPVDVPGQCPRRVVRRADVGSHTRSLRSEEVYRKVAQRCMVKDHREERRLVVRGDDEGAARCSCRRHRGAPQLQGGRDAAAAFPPSSGGRSRRREQLEGRVQLHPSTRHDLRR